MRAVTGLEMRDPPQRTRVPFAISPRDLDARTSVVSIEGDCDLASAPRLKWALIDLLAEGRGRLILDLSGVTFMDSTALGALVGVEMTLNAGEILVMAGAPPSVLSLFELTGLDRRLSLFTTLDAALAHARQTPSASSGHGEPGDPANDDSRRVEHQRGPAAPASTADHAYRDAAGEQTALTRDAALALGIATTAVPFARSPQARAERWLRVLRRCGGAGVALSSLGVTGIPLTRAPEHETVVGPESQTGTDRDEVATVTQHAHRLASHRGSSSIHTTDLLGAVIEVYGPDVDRLLVRHGTNRDAVVKLLGLELPAPGVR